MVYKRAEHTLSRQSVNKNALKVLYQLHQAGFAAYLVGGCVRDILLGYRPKDFDIATNAHPEQVRKLFRNCRLIGKRFRLAHILFGREIIEVATFRAHHGNAPAQHAHMHQGMIVRDNVYGTIEEDALRRDFSINALYYNIADFSVSDFTDGMQHLQERRLHMIGNPEERFLEDPVRLLRAIRIMGKLELTISPETEKPIIKLSQLLQHVSSARLFQEILKFFQEGASAKTFKLLAEYQLFQQLFPQTADVWHLPGTQALIETALKNTDQRIQEEKSISPAFLFAIFLWPVIANEIEKMDVNYINYSHYENTINIVLKRQKERLDIPKILLFSIREICLLQYRFIQRRGKSPYRLLDHPRFRAGYDLLLLRAATDESTTELGEWWTQFYLGDKKIRMSLLKRKIK